MYIDTHNHVMPTEALELLGRDPSFGVTIKDDEWSGAHHVPFRIHPSFYDLASKLASLDKAAIDAAIVSVSPTLFFYEIGSDAAAELCDASNAGMARLCEQAPERLRWLANLPVQDPGRAASMYREADAAGCVGAAVGTSIAGRRLDQPEFEELWAVAAELGHPVLVHPAFNEPHAGLDAFYLQNTVGNPLETTLMAERMICAGVLERHPRLRLLLLHGGGFLPYQAGRLRHARSVRPELAGAPADILGAVSQLYFDSIVHDPRSLRFLVDWAGSGHVVLGTDMPFDMSPPDAIGAICEALGEEGLIEVAARAPAALFGVAQWQG
ncbi:MAG: amidohydrolase family protein [Acidimicrobiales bacterium]